FGFVSDVHVAAAAKAVRKMVKRARGHGVEYLDVFLTAPGRQSSNADELVAALTRAAGVPARVLSTEEEGRLAYAGAVITAPVELAEALRLAEEKTPRSLARTYGVDRARSRILLGGMVLLAEVQRRLGVPLHVCDGGIREGAVLATVDQIAA